MIKSHEKSCFELIRGDRLKTINRIVLQINTQKQYENSNYGVYICETVSKEEFDLSTLETKLEAVEKQLKDEGEAYRLAIEDKEEKVKTLEKLLDEAREAREEIRNATETVQRENVVLSKALVECERIFGGLPKEIEALLTKGEDWKCIH